MKRKSVLKFIIVGLLVLFATVGLMGCSSKENKNKKIEKDITIKIIYNDSNDKETTKKHDIKTTDDTLDKVILNEKLGEGTEDTYGLFITTMDGRTADDSKEEWWCITKGGKELTTGASDTKVSDGDEFEFTLKVGY